MPVAKAPDIPMLARYMAERRWVDMRVATVGRADRVRIHGIDIRREIDYLHVEQRYVKADKVLKVEHVFDCEDVRWVRPSTFHLDQVKPLPDPKRRREDGPPTHRPAQIIDQIIRTVAFLTQDVDEQMLRTPAATGNYGALRARQEAMWLAYEMTDLRANAICIDHFGYKSQQPLLTMGQKVTYSPNAMFFNEPPGTWLRRVRITAGEIDRHFGRKYRRSPDTPPVWTKIL